MAEHDTLRFHRLIRSIRPPCPASRDAAGTIPMRAARYCEALTTASGMGWYVFTPLDMELYWDGADIHWRCDEFPEWMRLDDAAQFPHFSQEFDAMAPETAQGFAPPFLTRLPEPGTVQIWTGLVARTSPGWTLMVRPPVNLTPMTGFTQFEGILEADLWCGPLFANLRLTRTHEAIKLRADLPLLQILPLPRSAFAPGPKMELAENLDPTTWNAFIEDIIIPNTNPNRPPGHYATKTRRARRCPAGRG